MFQNWSFSLRVSVNHSTQGYYGCSRFFINGCTGGGVRLKTPMMSYYAGCEVAKSRTADDFIV